MPSTSTSTCRESVPRRKTLVLFPAPPSRDTLRPAYSSSNPARSRATLRSISSRVTTVTDWIASSAVCAVRVAVTVTTGATCSCAQTGRPDEQATATPCAKADKRIFIVGTPFAMPRVPARHGNLTWTHREPSRTEESRRTHRARRRHPAAHPPIRVPAGLRARALCRPGGRTGGSPSRESSQWLHDAPCAHLPLRGQHRHCGPVCEGPRTCFPFNPGRETPAGTDNALPLPGQWGRMIPYGAVSCTAKRDRQFTMQGQARP